MLSGVWEQQRILMLEHDKRGAQNCCIASVS